MNIQFPNLEEMTNIEAISWYLKQVVEVTNVKNRVAGTYSAEYKAALLNWKNELNKRVLVERNNLLGVW